MAVQNALLHLVRRQAPTTAVMTGNVVVATLALLALVHGPAATRAEARARWRSTWPLLLGFLTGCLVGAGALMLLHDAAWALPAAVALVPLLGKWLRRDRRHGTPQEEKA